jgi:hypothetical protein
MKAFECERVDVRGDAWFNLCSMKRIWKIHSFSIQSFQGAIDFAFAPTTRVKTKLVCFFLAMNNIAYRQLFVNLFLKGLVLQLCFMSLFLFPFLDKTKRILSFCETLPQWEYTNT